MERTQKQNLPARIERQLSHLKILSRLLGHELHAQNSPRLTLSREEVVEIQTSLDLFIEEVLRTRGSALGGASAGSHAMGGSGEVDVTTVPARVN